MFLLLSTAIGAPLGWEEVLDRALVEGVDARRAALALAEADLLLRSRQHQWDPAVSAAVGATFGTGAWGSTASPSWSASLRLDADMPLWHGGALRAARSAAEAEQAAAAADVQATRQAIVLAVADALVAVDEAREAVDVERSVLAAEEATAAQVRAQVAAGSRTRADALQQEAAVAAARAAVVGAEQALVATTLDAALLLRLDPAGDWSLGAPPPAPMVEGDVAALVGRAWAQRPDLGAARARTDAAEAGTREARAGRAPQLDAVGSVTTGLQSDGGSVGEQLLDGGGATVGLGLSVPLLDRGQTRAAIAGAGQDAEAAALAAAETRESVAVQVRAALSARNSARATEAAAGVRREAAAAALAVVEQRYAAGAALFVELAAARAASASASRAATAAEADRTRADYALAWAVGALSR